MQKRGFPLEEPRTNTSPVDPISQIEAEFPKPENPSQVLSGKRSSITILILGILLVFILLFIIGLVDKFNLLPRVARLTGNKDSITLIPSNPCRSDSTVLIATQRDGNLEVRTLNINTRSLGFVSDPTMNSFAPIESPTSNQVAYLTRDTQGNILLVVGQPGEIITDTVSVNTLGQINRERFKLCDYAQAAWSTNGKQIATFVCNEDSEESYLLITKVGGTNQILEKTRDNSNRERSVVWAGPTQVVYTQSKNDLDVVYTLDVLSPDKPIRLLGP